MSKNKNTKSARNNNATNPSRSELDREARKAALQEAKEVLIETSGADEKAFHPYISMYSMTLTVLHLVEIYDNQPGREQRYDALDKIAKEFNRLSALPIK